MGPLSRPEWITLLVFAGVGMLWLTTVLHRLDVTLVAFAGMAVLLVTGTMTWQTAAANGRPGMSSSGTAACCGWASC